MLKSPATHGTVILVWWCNGIDQNLEMHSVTITQIKGK
jgi:hypothetical protein